MTEAIKIYIFLILNTIKSTPSLLKVTVIIAVTLNFIHLGALLELIITYHIFAFLCSFVSKINQRAIFYCIL